MKGFIPLVGVLCRARLFGSSTGPPSKASLRSSSLQSDAANYTGSSSPEVPQSTWGWTSFTGHRAQKTMSLFPICWKLLLHLIQLHDWMRSSRRQCSAPPIELARLSSGAERNEYQVGSGNWGTGRGARPPGRCWAGRPGEVRLLPGRPSPAPRRRPRGRPGVTHRNPGGQDATPSAAGASCGFHVGDARSLFFYVGVKI